MKLGLQRLYATLLKAVGLLLVAVLGGSALSAMAQPATGQPAAPTVAIGAQYRLSPGDAVRITVFQNPDLSVDARLNEEGVIPFPLLRSVALGGLTATEAEARIADGLRKGDFIKQPQVVVLVTQVKGNQVTVLGQVVRPGRYPLESGDVRLTELLAVAGGVAPTGNDVVVVTGERDGKPYRVEVDLPTVYGSATRANDPILRNGDSIWVDRAPQMYIQGEVQRPGPVRVERGMNVRQALASAGGISQRGTERGIVVHRKDASGQTQVLPIGMTDAVKPEDVLVIKESLF